jgi:hypothetical protein
MTPIQLKTRWVQLLRQKAEYEHYARQKGEVVCSPSIDDICNEIEAFFTALNLIKNE